MSINIFNAVNLLASEKSNSDTRFKNDWVLKKPDVKEASPVCTGEVELTLDNSENCQNSDLDIALESADFIDLADDFDLSTSSNFDNFENFDENGSLIPFNDTEIDISESVVFEEDKILNTQEEVVNSVDSYSESDKPVNSIDMSDFDIDAFLAEAYGMSVDDVKTKTQGYIAGKLLYRFGYYGYYIR